MARTKTTTPAITLEQALAALKPFAHLPIRDDQPDDAHPAFQVQAGLVRKARELFPEDFAPVSAQEPEKATEGTTAPEGDEKAAGEPESGAGGEAEA